MNRSVCAVGLVALVSAAACSSNGTSNGTSNTNKLGSDAGVVSKTFKLTWQVIDVTAGRSPDAGKPDAAVVDAGANAANGIGQLPGLPGVAICVHDHPEIPCTTSDSEGDFELDKIPPLTNLIITLEKADYVKEVKVVQTASTDMEVTTGGIFMYRTTRAALPAGVTQDPTKGSMNFFAIGPVPGNNDPNAFETEADVSVALRQSGSDAAIESASEGPFFQNKGSHFQASKTTLNGLGFYYNLEPGDYTITFTDSQFDCAPLSLTLSAWGIPRPPTSVDFTVLPGYLTDEIGVFCTQKSVLVGVDGG